jgi:prepilin-type processing-associated H-X9-DG protein
LHKDFGGAGLKIFEKIYDFSNPGSIFVILDEHPDSLHSVEFHTPQAFLVLVKGQSNLFPVSVFDLPSSLHSGGAVLVYADGHASRKQWQDASTKLPVKYVLGYWENDLNAFSGPSNDYEWLGRHATELR